MAAKIGKDEDLTLPSTFSYVPIEKSDVISRGRMNKKGQSMFYASLSPDTNYREICHDIKEGDEVYLSKWGMKLDSSMMVLPVYLPQNIKVNADLSNYLGINNTFFTEGLMGKYIKNSTSCLLVQKKTKIGDIYVQVSWLIIYLSRAVLSNIRTKN